MSAHEDPEAKSSVEPAANEVPAQGDGAEAATQDAHLGSHKKAALSSAAWTMIGFGVMQVLRFTSNIILTRLLFPEVFGLMALVNTFIEGLHLFSDIGIGPSVVQSERGDDADFLNTAWTLQCIRGGILWVGTLCLAWPLALLYDEPSDHELPSLLWVLPAVGITAAINGFNSTKLYTLSRRMSRARLVALEIGAYLTFMVVAIGLIKLYQPTVWAVVAGGLAQSVVEMVWSHLLLRDYRNRFHWDWPSITDLLHFGKWIFISTVFTFFATRADRLVMGQVSLEMLGIYYLGSTLALMPTILMYALKDQMVFPLYCRYVQAARDVRTIFVRVHPAIMGFGAFLVSGLIGAGPTLIHCLYDFRYQNAGWMLQLLAIGAWFQMLETIGSAVLWAKGSPRVSAISNGVKAILLIILASLWFWYAHQKDAPEQGLRFLTGLLLIFIVGDFIRYLITLVVVMREHMPILRYDVALSLLIALTSGVTMFAGERLWPDRVRPEFLASFAFTADAGFPAHIPWWSLRLSVKPDFLHTFVRLCIESGIVTALWGGLGLAAWSSGMFQHKPTPEPPGEGSTETAVESPGG